MTSTRCERCGGALEVRTEGYTQGLYCTSCDWSVVTTNLPEIVKDQTVYDVVLVNGDFQNKEQVKTIAEVSGVNFLEARKILEGKAAVVFSGRAKDVYVVRQRLAAVGIAFEIRPEFGY